MKSILAKWMILSLRSKKLTSLTDDEIMEYLMKGTQSSTALINKIHKNLGDEHVKMLNLSHDWLSSYLPFVLQKINRVHFGLLQPSDVKQLEAEGVVIPTSRKFLAVPFVGKDVCSRGI
jgi:hypothetical protein